jgi:hypothetical protein
MYVLSTAFWLSGVDCGLGLLYDDEGEVAGT